VSLLVTWMLRGLAARAEHPESRPADADAPGRFRALAEAYQVLGDPAREGKPGARIPVRRPSGPGRRGGMTPLVRLAGPPLRAGPVRVEGRRAGRAAPADAADLRAGGTAGPGAQRGRHPPVLPPGHRPACRDLRADRRRPEPGRHPPGPAAAGGDPPAAGRGGPAEGTDRCPPGPCGTEIEAAYPLGRRRVTRPRGATNTSLQSSARASWPQKPMVPSSAATTSSTTCPSDQHDHACLHLVKRFLQAFHLGEQSRYRAGRVLPARGQWPRWMNSSARLSGMPPWRTSTRPAAASRSARKNRTLDR